MLRILTYLGAFLVMLGLVGNILGTASLLAQQLLTLGCLLLFLVVVHLLFKTTDE